MLDAKEGGRPSSSSHGAFPPGTWKGWHSFSVHPNGSGSVPHSPGPRAPCLQLLCSNRAAPEALLTYSLSLPDSGDRCRGSPTMIAKALEKHQLHEAKPEDSELVLVVWRSLVSGVPGAQVGWLGRLRGMRRLVSGDHGQEMHTALSPGAPGQDRCLMQGCAHDERERDGNGTSLGQQSCCSRRCGW